MNNSELDKLLKAVPLPDRPQEFWEQLPKRITAKVHWRERRTDSSNETPRSWKQSLGWLAASLAACATIVFALGDWRGPTHVNGLLRNEKLIREVLAMFPNQVEAIIEDDAGVHLKLADKPDVPDATPVWIKVCEGKRCRSFVTFSGQTLQIAGQRMEVLADARGDVMLVGERFFWSSSEAVNRDHLRVNAKVLHSVL